MKDLMEQFGVPFSNFPENPTPENLQNFSAAMIHELGDCAVDLKEQSILYHSVTATDDRPYKVAVEEATAESSKRLANTLRDSEHMLEFVKHQDEIDLLQVDKAQEQMILRKQPIHRLAEIGLAGRCFSVSQISEIADKISDLSKQV